MISIICVSYDFEEGFKYISEIMKIHEKYKNNEYVLVFKRGENNKKEHKNLKILQQKGKGIYNAMNLGYKTAECEWVIFSNVGDTFKRVPKKLYPKFTINAFPVDVYDSSGKFIFTRKLQKKMPSHQGMLINKKKLGDIAIFNEGYSYAADLDFYLRNKESSIFIDTSSISDFYLGGVSDQKSTFLKRKFERYIVILCNLKSLFIREKLVNDQSS